MEKAEWLALSDKIRACDRCSLFGPQKVIGDLGSDVKVVFIAEAPGPEEDLQGRPMVGPAGRLFRTWLRQIGLKEENVAILNVIKCFPPDMRKPLEGECSACGKWLEQQLDVIGCDKIVLVGGVASNYFFPEMNGRVIRFSGLVFKKGDRSFFIMPHPSYFLRNRTVYETEGLRDYVYHHNTLL